MRIMPLAGALLLIAGGSAIALAASPKPLSRAAALRVMHDRHDGMEKIGKATKAAGRALKSTPMDIAAIRASAATIARTAPKVAAWFPAGTDATVGKTRSKAEIWQKPADFGARAKEFEQAARVFDATARSGNLTAIQSGFGALAKTCKACHDSFRSEKDD